MGQGGAVSNVASPPLTRHLSDSQGKFVERVGAAVTFEQRVPLAEAGVLRLLPHVEKRRLYGGAAGLGRGVG